MLTLEKPWESMYEVTPTFVYPVRLVCTWLVQWVPKVAGGRGRAAHVFPLSQIMLGYLVRHDSTPSRQCNGRVMVGTGKVYVTW